MENMEEESSEQQQQQQEEVRRIRESWKWTCYLSCYIELSGIIPKGKILQTVENEINQQEQKNNFATKAAFMRIQINNI